MKKFTHFVLISIIGFAFYSSSEPFELNGKITSKQGFPIPNVKIQLHEKKRVIAHTVTDKFGNYSLPLPKMGTFKLIAGVKNKYFHPVVLKEFEIQKLERYTENFLLDIDKQVLQEECARLRESYKHMVHNKTNLSYKRAFLNRFPKSGIELEIFFSSQVEEVNLKKEAKRYIQTIFRPKFVGRNTYISLFILFAQHTDMRVAGKNTKKFYLESIPIINSNKEILFKELEGFNENQIYNVFFWMFSGGEFGKKKMTQSFDYLADKYPLVYTIMAKAYENYHQE